MSQLTPEPNHDPRERLAHQLRALPREIWILVGGLFVHRFGSFVIPFLTLYLSREGYTGGQIGLIGASLGIGGIAALFLGGRLTDWIGRKNTMFLSLLGAAVAMLTMWKAEALGGHAVYCLTAFVFQMTHGMFQPAAQSLIVDLVDEKRRITAFSVFRWASNIGFSMGLITAGLLAKSGYWHWLFIGDAVTSVFFGVVALLFLPHGIRSERMEESRWRVALRDILGNRKFVVFFAANLIAVVSFFHWASSAAKLVVDLGEPETVYSYLMAINALIIVFCEIPMSAITRRFPMEKMIATGFFLCGLGVWFNLFATKLVGVADPVLPGWAFMAVGLVIFTIGEMTAMPVSGAYVGSLAPKAMRGRYMAMIGLSWSLGHAIAPGVGLPLYESHPEVLWWGCLTLAIVSTALMMLGSFGGLGVQRVKILGLL